MLSNVGPRLVSARFQAHRISQTYIIHCQSLLVVAGLHWSSLVFAGLCWSLPVFAGLRQSLLVVVVFINSHLWLSVIGDCGLQSLSQDSHNLHKAACIYWASNTFSS